jgi:DNA (cytosine-5)-methyltransferase 1
MKQRVLRAFDMFSGVGGFRIGADQLAAQSSLKFKWVGRAEVDQKADLTYSSFFGHDNQNWGDIQNLTGPLEGRGGASKERAGTRQLPTGVDILFAGFPCQPFSSMGARRGLEDARGTLFFAIAAFLREFEPRYFVLENVRGLKSDAGGATLQLMRDILAGLGYHVAVWTLNSADYGVPQTRRRVYIVGEKSSRTPALNDDELPDIVAATKRRFPSTWHLLERDVKRLYPDKDYYLSEKIKPTILSSGSGNFRYKWSIDNLVAKPLCRTMHKMHRASQDNYFSDSYILGKFDESNSKVIHAKAGKSRIRRLTPLEAFRLQGLPDEMVAQAKANGLSDTQLYMQAGNAVSASTVTAVLRKLIKP